MADQQQQQPSGRVIRWGILSTGIIARKFAQALQLVDNAQLVAVASRTKAAADAFAQTFNVARAYGTYEELYADPDVDVVYIGTPHYFHYENGMACLRNNKSVLCEKSFTMNYQQALEMVQLAREKKLFLMEAMWTRFLPLMVALKKMLAEDKVIGDIRMLKADLGFCAQVDYENRIYNPLLGGGALLDVGIYPISFAFFVFGGEVPAFITTMAQLNTKTKIDEQNSITFGYANNQKMAVLTTSVVSSYTTNDAVIVGTRGRVRIHAPWHISDKLTLIVEKPGTRVVQGIVESGEFTETVLQFPIGPSGYKYEAEEVVRCMLAGKTESETMPLDETLAIMKVMDQLRENWGLKYPFELEEEEQQQQQHQQQQ